MKVRVRNNAEAPQGVELVGGGYRFIPPGKEREADAANPGLLYKLAFLEVTALEAMVPDMPESLVAKAAGVAADMVIARTQRSTPAKMNPPDLDGDGVSGGSPKGMMSTAAVGARRKRARRRKAASK